MVRLPEEYLLAKVFIRTGVVASAVLFFTDVFSPYLSLQV
jgi:hypothetical protein